MKLTPRNHSRREISISIVSGCRLLEQSLTAQINDERGMNVQNAFNSDSDVINSIVTALPDIVLLCLLDGEGEKINFISNLKIIAPEVKIVILNSPGSGLDQMKAVKLGVAGIVSTKFDSTVLLRALWQVSEGDVWFNQKLLSKLLADNFSSGPRKAQKCGFLKSDDLTARELEVVAMIGNGLCNREIATRMCISEATVQRHLSTIYSKLQIEDRLNLAIYAYRNKLLVPGNAAATKAGGLQLPVYTAP
jgi:two-component system, NarL family, response regulator DegU